MYKLYNVIEVYSALQDFFQLRMLQLKRKKRQGQPLALGAQCWGGYLVCESYTNENIGMDGSRL